MQKKPKAKKRSGKRPLVKKAGRGRKIESVKEPIEKSNKEVTADAGSNSFIHPDIIKISEKFVSGEIQDYKEDIPTQLHPFLQTLDLTKLAQALKRKPGLYFDPIVKNQIFYLTRLKYDQRLWDQLRWGIEGDDSHIAGGWAPPEEVAQVEEFLKMLLAAHVKALFPYRKLELKSLPRPGGRKGGLKNLNPTSDPWTQFIDAQTIDEDYESLKELIKKNIHFPSVVNPNKQTRKRINLQAMKVLEESQIYWSGLRKIVSNGPAFDSNKAKASDSENTRHISFLIPYWEEKWEPLDLDEDIKDMCSGKDMRSKRIEKTKKDGKPAYLAYAILGCLLDVHPWQIRNVIDNYRHPRPSRKKSTS